MRENESIEQAVRRAERATNGSIAMMIEAGIRKGFENLALPGQCCPAAPDGHNGWCTAHRSHYGVPSGPITPDGWVPGTCLNSPEHPCPDGAPHNADYAAWARDEIAKHHSADSSAAEDGE